MTLQMGSKTTESLIEAPDYRSFITTVIGERKKVRDFGYAAIARNGGFRARSFPRDVVLGKKKITLTSLPKFIKGLGLSIDLAEYFKLLVEIEEVNCRTKNYEVSKLLGLKENLKKRLRTKNKIHFENSEDLNFIYSSIPKIYAALGEAKVGVTIDQIIIKTNLTETETLKSLQFMVQRKLITRSKGRYFSTENHLNFQNLSSDVFKKHFIKTASDSIEMSKKNIQSNEKLFLSSSFSVSQKDLSKLKEELRSVILRYIDNAEDPRGDKVISLVASLY